tara:strand:+ start:1645 stop:1890 length:246 start_codon:yes stop_codon:yes gene_type:complete
MKRKKKKSRLTDSEMKSLFYTSLLNPDLYPDKKKKIPIELEEKDGSKDVKDFTVIGLIGFVGMIFHILEHEYFDSLKKNES